MDLTESNPTRAGFSYPDDLLAPLADARALDYDPQPLGLWPARAAAAADFRRRGIVLSADRVALTSSTSEAYALLFKLLCDAGDHVLVPRPSYPLFEHLTQMESVTARAVLARVSRRVAHRSRFASRRGRRSRARDPDRVAQQPDRDRSCTATISTQLAELAAARNLPLIGDEVFADYRLDPSPASTHVLAASDVLTFSLGGLSKSAGLPQLKLGWIGFGGPSAKVDETIAAYEIVADTYLSVSTPVQAAAAELIERGAAIRGQILARLKRNLESLRTHATSFPAIAVLPVEGGWSAVVQVPSVGSEEALVLDLLDKDDILVHPGYFFDFPREAFIVVSLLVEPALFDKAIARVLPRVAGRS